MSVSVESIFITPHKMTIKPLYIRKNNQVVAFMKFSLLLFLINAVLFIREISYWDHIHSALVIFFIALSGCLGVTLL